MGRSIRSERRRNVRWRGKMFVKREKRRDDVEKRDLKLKVIIVDVIVIVNRTGDCNAAVFITLNAIAVRIVVITVIGRGCLHDAFSGKDDDCAHVRSKVGFFAHRMLVGMSIRWRGRAQNGR